MSWLNVQGFTGQENWKVAEAFESVLRISRACKRIETHKGDKFGINAVREKGQKLYEDIPGRVLQLTMEPSTGLQDPKLSAEVWQGDKLRSWRINQRRQGSFWWELIPRSGQWMFWEKDVTKDLWLF